MDSKKKKPRKPWKWGSVDKKLNKFLDNGGNKPNHIQPANKTV